MSGRRPSHPYRRRSPRPPRPRAHPPKRRGLPQMTSTALRSAVAHEFLDLTVGIPHRSRSLLVHDFRCYSRFPRSWHEPTTNMKPWKKTCRLLGTRDTPVRPADAQGPVFVSPALLTSVDVIEYIRSRVTLPDWSRGDQALLVTGPPVCRTPCLSERIVQQPLPQNTGRGGPVCTEQGVHLHSDNASAGQPYMPRTALPQRRR